MKVNWKVIETDDKGTRTLAEREGFDVPGDDFPTIKAKFEADMRRVFAEYTAHATREYVIEPCL